MTEKSLKSDLESVGKMYFLLHIEKIFDLHKAGFNVNEIAIMIYDKERDKKASSPLIRAKSAIKIIEANKVFEALEIIKKSNAFEYEINKTKKNLQKDMK
ncbi:hypothetical protein [Helicobacter sp. T3_23-1059]